MIEDSGLLCNFFTTVDCKTFVALSAVSKLYRELCQKREIYSAFVDCKSFRLFLIHYHNLYSLESPIMRSGLELFQLTQLRKFQNVENISHFLLRLYNDSYVDYTTSPLPKHSLIYKLEMGLCSDILRFLELYRQYHSLPSLTNMIHSLVKGSTKYQSYKGCYDFLHAIALTELDKTAWGMQQVNSLNRDKLSWFFTIAAHANEIEVCKCILSDSVRLSFLISTIKHLPDPSLFQAEVQSIRREKKDSDSEDSSTEPYEIAIDVIVEHIIKGELFAAEQKISQYFLSRYQIESEFRNMVLNPRVPKRNSQFDESTKVFIIVNGKLKHLLFNDSWTASHHILKMGNLYECDGDIRGFCTMLNSECELINTLDETNYIQYQFLYDGYDIVMRVTNKNESYSIHDVPLSLFKNSGSYKPKHRKVGNSYDDWNYIFRYVCQTFKIGYIIWFGEILSCELFSYDKVLENCLLCNEDYPSELFVNWIREKCPNYLDIIEQCTDNRVLTLYRFMK